jgi:2-haloacid dehalogenase
MASVDVVVWDFGGVLFDWDPAHLYRKVFETPDELDHFLTVVCPRDWHFQHDAGVRFAETLPVRRAQFPDHAAAIDVYLERYVEMISGAMPGMHELVAELRSNGVRQYGLTNMPEEPWPAIQEAWPMLTELDGVVVSGVEKLVKPDPAIFRLLSERFDLEPARSVFVDDVARNVDAAVACGFEGIVYSDAPQVRAELRALGLRV